MSREGARYPDDSLQDVLGFTQIGAKGWWEPQRERARLERGALLMTFVTHPNVPPQELVVAGESRGAEHAVRVTLTRAQLGARHPSPERPAAALPWSPPERLLVERGAVRPAIVVSHRHGYPPQPSERGKWITAPLIQVAPMFLAETWPAPLVDSVRRAQHPQYVWDRPPIDESRPAILRLDALQSLHREHTELYRFTGFRLAADALEIIDDWLMWWLTGTLPEGGDLLAAHTMLGEL